MAFTFGASAQINISTANPIALALTTPANTRLLVVGVATNDIVVRTGGAPTYNGAVMTQVGATQVGAAECTCELWYLSNPSIGAYSVSVPNAGALIITVIASCYIDAGVTGAALDVYNQTNVSVADPSLTVTTGFDGEVVVDMLGSGYRLVETGRSHTLLYATDEGVWNTAAQYALLSTAGAITLSHTQASDDVAFVVGAFKGTIGATITLAGTASGIGTATGAISLTQVLSGTASGIGTATGAISLTRSLSGIAGGIGTAIGAMSLILPLKGTASGIGLASGVLSKIIPLTGLASGVGSAVGALTVTGTAVTLAGMASGIGKARGGIIRVSSNPPWTSSKHRVMYSLTFPDNAKATQMKNDIDTWLVGKNLWTNEGTENTAEGSKVNARVTFQDASDMDAFMAFVEEKMVELGAIAGNYHKHWCGHATNQPCQVIESIVL